MGTAERRSPPRRCSSRTPKTDECGPRRSTRACSSITNAFSVEAPTPRNAKAVLAALVRWCLRVGVGITFLDLYLRLVAFLMAAAGVAVAPLVTALIALTATLLVVPANGRVDRAITRTLKPAVDAVDAQIACVFIPYITAVPVSNLPAGGDLWTAAAACAAGTLATMFAAGKVAQAFSPSSLAIGAEEEDETAKKARAGEKEKKTAETADSTDARSAVRVRRLSAAEAARAVCRGTPLELLWLLATATLVPLALIPWVDLSFHTTAAPAYICATATTYLLARRVPAGAQRLGLFPTVTGGVAMACLASAVGCLTGVGAEAGIRDYLAGAGAVFLYFVPPAVLGLAFRVRAQAETLRKNATPLALAVAVAVPGGLLLAAALGNACGLPADVVLASLPKCTTTGLAVHMAGALGVDASLAAAGCALSGTIGLSAGRALMDAMRIRGAIARGAATGASSHAAGTAALAAAGEDAAAAVAGVVFALSGVFGVLLLEVPRFRAALLAVAGAGA